MAAYLVLSFLLLVTAVLSRSGAQSQAQSPSLVDFAAFCNEIDASGGSPSPFIEVLCRQLAERGVPQAPSNPTASWIGEGTPNVSQESSTATTDPGTVLDAQSEQVTEKQANDSAVVPLEPNNTSVSQSRDNEVLNVDNVLPAADNTTDTFPVREGQSVIVLNYTLPKQQVNPEGSGGSDISSFAEVSLATVHEISNKSAVQPEMRLIHLQPHNVSTLYVGQRAQSEVLGLTGQNVNRAFQTNLKPVKRGDQMPVLENETVESSANVESSINQTLNYTETLDQIPDIGTQQSLDEGGLSIQQSEIQNSNSESSINQSTGIINAVETEQKNAHADISNVTKDSTSEGQLYEEQVSTIVTTESEAFMTTEVVRESLYNASKSNMTATEIQGTGHGSTGNGSSAQVNNSANVIIGSNVDGVSEAESSQNIPTQSQDNTQSTIGISSVQVNDEINEPSLNSEKVTSGGQSIVEQGKEVIPQDLVSVITQSDQGDSDYTAEIQPAVEYVKNIGNTTASTTLNTALVYGEESISQLPVTVGVNLGNYNPNELNTASREITTIVSASNISSEQDTLSNIENGMGSGQQTLVPKPAKNNKSEILDNQSVAVDLSQQALPGIGEVPDTAGLDAQHMNQGDNLAKGDNSSDWNIKYSTQHLGMSGRGSVATTTQASTGVSSSRENSINSTLLAANNSGSSSQLPDGVSTSEGNSAASPSLPPKVSGSTSQSSAGVSYPEGNSVASPSISSNSSGSTSHPTAGVPSSEGNSAASPTLPQNPSVPTHQLPVGVSTSEEETVASPSLPTYGSASQLPFGVSASEGNSVSSLPSAPKPSGATSQPSAGVPSSEGNAGLSLPPYSSGPASPMLPQNPSVPTHQLPAGLSTSEGETVASPPLPTYGSASQLPAGVSASVGNSVSSLPSTPKPSGDTSQPSAGVPSSEGNAGPSLPPYSSGPARQPSVGVSASEGSSVAFPSLSSKPDGMTSHPSFGVSSSEGYSAAPTSFPPTSEGDSMLLLRELSTELLGGLAEVHCRQLVNDFWKNVTEVFQRVSASHEPTVSDMTSIVTGLIESYRRESPYWATIAAELEEATSDGRWRQLVASVARRRRGDPSSQLRLVRAARQLREAVRAAISAPECRQPGASPAADSCERFVLCHRADRGWRALTLSCPRGSAFSSSERRCVWRPLARCDPAPSRGGWVDDDGDSDSDSDSDSDFDSDSNNSEERGWSLFGHTRSLFRMFH